MKEYLGAIHHPEDYDPSVAEDAAMDRTIDAPSKVIVTAGLRVFVNGLEKFWAPKSFSSPSLAGRG
jgi:hypothetical protein